MSQADAEKLERELKGKTLQVYWYVLQQRKDAVGVRELQRILGFSSPSVAAYHLDKLKALGLVEERAGDYYLKKEVKVGAFVNFVVLGRFALPRYFFYAVLFTSMLVTYLVMYPQVGTIHNTVALIFGGAAVIILWYETFRILRQKPSKSMKY